MKTGILPIVLCVPLLAMNSLCICAATPTREEAVIAKGSRGNYLPGRVTNRAILFQQLIGNTIVVTCSDALAISLEKAEAIPSLLRPHTAAQCGDHGCRALPRGY